MELCTVLKSQNKNIFPSTRKVYKHSNLDINLEIVNLDIVNKTQLPLWQFTKHITFDIVNYLI